jgi:hypothetical protein
VAAGRLPMWLGRVISCAIGLTLAMGVSTSLAQGDQTSNPTPPPVNTQLPVNWLYGAYIPKDVPIVALNGSKRFKLYVRQTYTTPGIYIKTGFFAVHDQVRNSPSAWGDDFSGFAKRVGSNQATNIIQNSFTSLGQGLSAGNRATIVAAARGVETLSSRLRQKHCDLRPQRTIQTTEYHAFCSGIRGRSYRCDVEPE